METSIRCPQCGKALSAGAPLGLCPECLLRAGFATRTQPAPAKTPRFVPPKPGELAPLFPQLEILALIGQGGMGAVYRTRQPSLDRIVALKILPPQAGGDPGFAERFTREARALARLNHPNIVAVHDFGAAGDYHYFIMEFVDGVTLRHLLATAKSTPREALAIVPQICDALQFAHDRGIVHRDIKPDNILIDRNGTVKIADFGLAKIIGAELPDFSITGEHDVMGTPHYMAPEQVEHPLEVDHRADIYSLGVVFYQMLTGELPLGRFAPPSRRVQIDVRLDEVVLRALEKEPERRYQQASGLKSEVETIATSTVPRTAAPEADDAEPNRHLSRRRLNRRNDRARWWMLGAVWILAGILLWQQARFVKQYLDTVAGLGRRAQAVDAPLQQMYPGFAADAQMWVRHALALTEGNTLQLRHTDLDNAPHGREVHWNSAWAWCIAGAGELHRLFTGLSFPRAVERSTLWLNPLAMFACVLVMSAWATRHLGTIAGVFVAVAMICDNRIYEGFFPSYVDHHGLQTVAVFGLMLGAIVMRGGWSSPAHGVPNLAASSSTAKNGAIFSAVSGACGMWIGAASTAPAIGIVGVAGLLVVILQGRAAVRGGAVFEAAAWRSWGRVGAVASLAFYLLEYFPSHLGLRLEANHPFYALAWLGGGELVAHLGERWLARREQHGAERWAPAWAALSVGVLPASIVIGGSRVFAVSDPFMAHLHRDYVQEFLPLWETLKGLEPRRFFEMIQVGTLPLLAAIVTLVYRRRDAPVELWFATLATAALTAMAWWQARWLLNAVGASIALLLVLLAGWTSTLRPFVRWAVAVVILGQFFVPSAVLRYLDSAKDVAARRVAPNDAANALSRDIAGVLRASQPQGDIVLLASPNASGSIGYYGRFKTLGTLYWENSDGLKAAARMLAAGTEAEAAALIRERGVTHIALVSQENFIKPYFRLLHPGASDEEVGQCFGVRLLRGEAAPAWLQKISYEIPDDLRALKTTVLLFKVKFE